MPTVFRGKREGFKIVRWHKGSRWWHKGSRYLNIIWPSSLFPGRGGLPCKELMGMCHSMGSYFHNWIDYNGVAFSIELLEWGHTFSRFLGVRQFFIFTVSKWELKQQWQRQLRKRHSKLKVCSCCFKVYWAYYISFILTNTGELFGSWILKDSIKVQKKKKRVILCSRFFTP